MDEGGSEIASVALFLGVFLALSVAGLFLISALWKIASQKFLFPLLFAAYFCWIRTRNVRWDQGNIWL